MCSLLNLTHHHNFNFDYRLSSFYFSSIRDNQNWNDDIQKFISVLNSFVHPYIPLAIDIIERLDNSSFLQTIKNINLTELMYYVSKI